MRKKTYPIIVLVCVFLLLLAGCSKDDNPQFVLEKDSVAFDVSLVPLSIPEGMAPSVYCVAFGNKVYYLVNFSKPMSNAAERSVLYEYDMVTGIRSLLCSWEDPETYWVNELRAGADMVYWTRLTTDERCLLEGFDLRTQEICQIYSARYLIVLGGDNEYLAWYDAVTTDYVDTVFYDMSAGQVFSQRQDAMYLDDWDRLSMHDDKLLILRGDDDTCTFSLLDVKTNEAENLFVWPQEKGCATPQLSERYIVWREDFGRTLIYIYDIEKDQIFEVDTKELGISNVASIRLVDNLVYLNTRSDAWCLRLDTRTYGAIAQDILGELSSDTYVTHEFALESQQVFLLREDLDSTSDYRALVVRPK